MYNTWVSTKHTGSSMASDWPAAYGCGYAAHSRSVNYIDSDSGYHNASLVFHTFPTFEGDDSIPGLCGLFSGGFTSYDGYDGGYTIGSSASPCASGWDPYFYYGGGILEP